MNKNAFNATWDTIVQKIKNIMYHRFSYYKSISYITETILIIPSENKQFINHDIFSTLNNLEGWTLTYNNMREVHIILKSQSVDRKDICSQS